MNIVLGFAGSLLIVAGVPLLVARRFGLVGLLALGAILFGLRKRDHDKSLVLIPPEAGSSWRLAAPQDGLRRSRFDSREALRRCALNPHGPGLHGGDQP